MNNKRSSWITYTDGKAIEHLHYLPYGETQVDQRATSYAARYTFSAKEKDEETGYSYFGARYYNSDLSIWLSVDPMADKYPNMSPYVYCADNPVKLVDPDGEEWYVNEDGYIKIGKNSDDHNVYFVKGKSKNNFDDFQKDSNGNKIAVDIGDDMKQYITEEDGSFKHDDKEESYTAHSFDISDEKTAQKLFRYMSKYTDNEWSFWGDDKGSHLSTSHISWTDIYGGWSAEHSGESGKLSFFFHTHPRNEEYGVFVNNTDRAMRDKCLEKSPNAVIGIMHRGILYDFKSSKINWDGTKK